MSVVSGEAVEDSRRLVDEEVLEIALSILRDIFPEEVFIRVLLLLASFVIETKAFLYSCYNVLFSVYLLISSDCNWLLFRLFMAVFRVFYCYTCSYLGP